MKKQSPPLPLNPLPVQGDSAPFAANLLAWYDHLGVELPWRGVHDPYRIWLSEIMLQQTQVETVKPYFARFLDAYPTAEALAAAPLDDVLKKWEGLGYYSRARNLHKAAQAIVAAHQGKVPKSAEKLRSLPGVGGYTAAAIAAFAFDAVEPVIDANIARVLARLFGWEQSIDDTAGKIFLEKVARELLPARGGRLHNSALMELGALICIPRTPRCLACPVRGECRAKNPGILPIKRVRKTIEEVTETRAFITDEGKLWLTPSPGPRWRGMWVLPLTDPDGRMPNHVEVHPITRFRVTMRLFQEPRLGRAFTPFDFDGLPPMPSPHLRAVAAMREKLHS